MPAARAPHPPKASGANYKSGMNLGNERFVNPGRFAGGHALHRLRKLDGAVQKSLMRPATSIAHAATRKTASAMQFELWADRASSASVAADQLHYALQRSLISWSCHVSRCATPTRPTRHVSDHVTPRPALQQPPTGSVAEFAFSTSKPPQTTPIAGDCPPNQAEEKSAPCRQADGPINNNLFGLGGSAGRHRFGWVTCAVRALRRRKGAAMSRVHSGSSRVQEKPGRC
jgi:hypothetical protein